MKNFILIAFVLTTGFGFSQVKIALPSDSIPADTNENVAPNNVSCASSFRVCENVHQTFEFTPNQNGSCSSNTLFYTFNFAGPSNLGLQVNLIGAVGTWEWYGPFSENSLGLCDQIYSYSASSISGSISGSPVSISNASAGFYILKLTTSSCQGTVSIMNSGDIRYDCTDKVLCTECVTSFSPTPGKYIVSAWVKEKDAPIGTTSYSNSSIEISFQNSTVIIPPLLPTGAIIDGWQRIETEIEVPVGATGITIELIAGGADVYFDDIRFFPFDGSMMSYVYDPVSLRLMAELDERNYATLYEYDEEGKLIRVKKETEKGIMTIQENRDNIKKN